MRDSYSTPWLQQVALHEQWISDQPWFLDRLHRRVGEGWGLDGSVASIARLEEWMLATLPDAANTTALPLPLWWNPEWPTAEADSNWPFTRAQLNVIDEATAYVGDVLLRASSRTRWTLWKGRKIDGPRGRPHLQFDEARTPNARNALDLRNSVYNRGLMSVDPQPGEFVSMLPRIEQMLAAYPDNA